MTYGVVLASFNYGHLAAHCIETVLDQSRKFDEMYFVDDGAGDCGHLQHIYRKDKIQFVLRDLNLGIIANFNDMLFDHVNTDYVMFLGADNWLRPDALEMLENCVENTGADIVTYDIMVVGPNKMEIRDAYSNEVNWKHRALYWDRKGKHHGSMLYNVDMAQDLGGYARNNPGGKTDEDLNLWNKMKGDGAKIAHVPESLLYYRRHNYNFNNGK